MIAHQYGVGVVRFKDNEGKEFPCVQFGDGMTSMITLHWENNNVGIKIKRLEEGVEPFSEVVYYNESNPEPKGEGEELYLFFDNTQSINALIDRLEYIKADLLKTEIKTPAVIEGDVIQQ